MFRMWREQAMPRVLEGGAARAIRSTTLRTIGIGESAAEEILQDLVALEDPVVATYAKDDGVHVRVTSVAATGAEAESTRDAAVAEVRARLGRYVYAADDTTLPEALAVLLEDHPAMVAIEDIGGGGRFAALLASHPASSTRLATAALRPSGDGTAADLATIAATRADVGVGIRVDVSAAGDGVFEGEIVVAIAGIAHAEERMPMRSGWEDIQRRSALHAADMLRRALVTVKD
jgi:nicotinamide-nucleotide amidase